MNPYKIYDKTAKCSAVDTDAGWDAWEDSWDAPQPLVGEPIMRKHRSLTIEEFIQAVFDRMDDELEDAPHFLGSVFSE